MNSKTIKLTLLSISIMFMLYLTPATNKWMHAKIFTVCNIPQQLTMMEPISRKLSRYGYSYSLFLEIAEKMKEQPGYKTLLLPTTNYLKANKVNTDNLQMVEPSSFYYYCGLNAVNQNSPKVLSANWVLLAQDGGIGVVRVKNKEDLDKYLAIFRKYP